MTATLCRDVEKSIRRIGAKWGPEILAATRVLYEPLVRDMDGVGVTVVEDVAYGEDSRQKLDLYQPEGTGHPILIFIQGGGYRSGEKNDGIFYRNLGIYFAKRGFLTVVPNYRLSPQHPWPAGAEDVGAAIEYVRHEAYRFGGNPECIFVLGHSAGATHAACYLFDRRFHPPAGNGIRSVALISGGGYSVDRSAPPARLEYFGNDAAQWDDRSPIMHIDNNRVPLFIGVGEFDPVSLSIPSFELAQAVTKRDGKVPKFHVFADHNHISTIFSIGSPDDAVGGALCQFFRSFISPAPA